MTRYQHSANPFEDWDSFFSDPFKAFAPLFRSTLSSAYERPRQSIEWYEDDENYHARLELPGVKRDQLRLNAEEGLVHLTCGEENSESAGEGFERVFRCPEGVDLSAIEACLEDGILELTLPKAPEKKPIDIEIR
jgi:HSP20 family protein